MQGARYEKTEVLLLKCIVCCGMCVHICNTFGTTLTTLWCCHIVSQYPQMDYVKYQNITNTPKSGATCI